MSKHIEREVRIDRLSQIQRSIQKYFRECPQVLPGDLGAGGGHKMFACGLPPDISGGVAMATAIATRYKAKTNLVTCIHGWAQYEDQYKNKAQSCDFYGKMNPIWWPLYKAQSIFITSIQSEKQPGDSHKRLNPVCFIWWCKYWTETNVVTMVGSQNQSGDVYPKQSPNWWPAFKAEPNLLTPVQSWAKSSDSIQSRVWFCYQYTQQSSAW